MILKVVPSSLVPVLRSAPKHSQDTALQVQYVSTLGSCTLFINLKTNSFTAKYIFFPSSSSSPQQLTSLARKVDPQTLQVVGAVSALFLFILGFSVSFTIVLVLITCLSMLGFAAHLALWVMAKDEGTADMQEVSLAIRDGAEGYFVTQYGTIARLSGLLCGIIFVVYLFRTETPEQASAGISRFTLAFLTSASFMLGAGCSAVAGYTGMWYVFFFKKR